MTEVIKSLPNQIEDTTTKPEVSQGRIHNVTKEIREIREDTHKLKNENNEMKEYMFKLKKENEEIKEKLKKMMGN